MKDEHYKLKPRRTYMKKLSVFVLTLLILMSMTAFSLDLSSVDPSDIDLSKVDLSGMDIYFQGPIEFYVEDVVYDGKAYAAILDYDGAGKLTIEVPKKVSTYLKPQAIDLTDTDVFLRNGKVYLDNVVVENYSYSGYLSFNPPASFVAEVGTIAAAPVSPSTRPAVSSSVAELREEVSSLEKKIKQKDYQIEQKNKELTQKEKDIKQKERQLSQKEDQIGDLSSELRQKERQVAVLENEVARAGTMIPNQGFRAARVSTADAMSGMGSWDVSRTRARQTNAGQKFAKFIVNARQANNEYVYSFTGKGSSSGWSGYGFHFLASGSKSAKGYGYGDSYLVWVTRDPDNLQTDKTFIQLYRSYNDVRMVQLANQAIDKSISDNLDIEVYVNRGKGQIMVSVEGSIALIYNENALMASGNEIVLRALGTAEFRNARLKTK